MSKIIPLNTNILSTRADTLPPHITADEYERIRTAVNDHWKGKTGKKAGFYCRRDTLFIDLLWQTGARVGDLCTLTIQTINWDRHTVTIPMQKVRRDAIVTLDSETLLEISRFVTDFGIEDRLFDFNRKRAYNLIRLYSREAGLAGIHPHKFRHGLAIHMLGKGIPIPVISARLGHSSVMVTMEMYMKVTPDIQEQFTRELFR